MVIRDESVNVGLDPALVPLENQDAAELPPVWSTPTGALRSLDGLPGPDLLFATAAPLNNVAISKSSGGSTVTFGITGVGTMAQRNAIAAVADETTADAIDPATTMALVNALKAKINELLAKARTANHLTP